MTKGNVKDELEKRAARVILARSVYRWESAVILALTLLLCTLPVVSKPFPFWHWWFWLILGVVGEVGLIWSSVKDPEFRARAVAEMFHEEFRPARIGSPALRDQVEKALDYRDKIDKMVTQSRESVMREHLKEVTRGVDDWMDSVFRLAQRLDAYETDKTIRQDMQSTQTDEIEQLKKRLALEDDDTVKRQISQVIAQKQIQRDNLHKLQNVMEQAQLQLESTTTAMSTVYSQVMILNARDVASGRAQRLQQDIAGQVQALQDVVRSMDEVYKAGTGPVGFGMSSAAPSTTAQKGTSGN